MIDLGLLLDVFVIIVCLWFDWLPVDTGVVCYINLFTLLRLCWLFVELTICFLTLFTDVVWFGCCVFLGCILDFWVVVYLFFD